MERRAKAQADRHSKPVLKSTTLGRAPPKDSGAPIYLPATDVMELKYTDLAAQLQTLRPYHPLSLTGLEPTDRQERYRYIEDLQKGGLRFPAVLLKVDVGGSIGTLHWVLKREDGGRAAESVDIEDARSLIKPLIPQIHNRALKRAFNERLHGLVKMPDSVRTFLYKELTGDESSADWMAKKECDAFLRKQLELAETFTLGIGDSDLVLDIRTIFNAGCTGKTAFSEFWDCVQEELDDMNTAAEERRHGGVVAYLSELISQRELFDRCVTRFEHKK